MSTLVEQPTRNAPGRPSPVEPAPGSPRLAGRYLGYVLYFVGAGLISGAVVHHPLDPARYTAIGLVGAALFTTATIINEFVLAPQRPALRRAALLIGASLVLSFGIGMLSGGMQHFEEFPTRAAILVPAGIVVSFVGFVVRDPLVSWRRVASPLGITVAAVAVVTYLALHAVAGSMESSELGHDHHSETPSQEVVSDNLKPLATEPESADLDVPATTPDEHDAGVDDHGHDH